MKITVKIGRVEIVTEDNAFDDVYLSLDNDRPEPEDELIRRVGELIEKAIDAYQRTGQIDNIIPEQP